MKRLPSEWIIKYNLHTFYSDTTKESLRVNGMILLILIMEDYDVNMWNGMTESEEWLLGSSISIPRLGPTMINF